MTPPYRDAVADGWRLLAPSGRLADPAVLLQFAVEHRGQGTLVARGEVGFDVPDFAHAWNDGRDVGVIEDEAESHFGHRRSGGNQRLEGVGTRHARAEIFRNEVGAAPVVGGPGSLERKGSGEGAFVERYAGDDGDILRAAGGEELVFGVLVEDVVDDLHGVDEAGFDGADAVAGLPAVHADADSADFAAGPKLLDGANGTLFIEPAVFPGVVLDEVEGSDADVRKTLFNVLKNVFGRVRDIQPELAARRPLAVFGRDLARHVELFVRMGSEGFAEQLFAVPVAVGPGGVEEIAAKSDGTVEGTEGLGIVGAGPAGHTPHAVADFADLPVGAAESAVAQGTSFRGHQANTPPPMASKYGRGLA